MVSGNHISLTISEFLKISKEAFTGMLRNEDNQIRTWDHEYDHLRKIFTLLKKNGRIIFEYGIPSQNFVIDVVVLMEGKVFVLEYKDGDSATNYSPEDLKQCRNYALRLKYFHSTSNDKWIIPILVEMNAPAEDFVSENSEDIQVWNTIKCNKDNLKDAITKICMICPISCNDSWETTWEKGIYKATPTIIEAACKMWERNNVRGLDSGESDKDTRLDAEDFVMKIVEQSKEKKKKSIVFVTGVPGAGKTLVGLGLSVRCQEYGASMLSGNDPLVKVLSTALRRDLEKQYKNGMLKEEIAKKYEHAKEQKKQADRDKEKDSISVDAVIRTANAYKREIIESRLNWEDKTYVLRKGADPGTQHVIIFDEAQRAWTRDKMLKPGRSGKKPWQDKATWPFSEPGLLLWDMNQRDWGVFVCLVGGGQEINNGEAGIGEWMSALTTKDYLKDWQVYVSQQLLDPEYQRKAADGKSLADYCKDLETKGRLSNDPDCNKLHLAAGQRSIRNTRVSDFINHLLACNKNRAQDLYKEIFATYKIYLTRDVNIAKKKLREMKESGSYPEGARMGMLMSSEAARLRPLGYEIKKVKEYLSKTPNWFLDTSDYICSSDFLEIALNEFFVQGLEVDYAVVMWDADFRYNPNIDDNDKWEYYNFDGKLKWNKKPEQDIKRFYMKNAYRVILTRARLGMIIMVPEGDENDSTRKKEFYDNTYEYLKEIGLEEIK